MLYNIKYAIKERKNKKHSMLIINKENVPLCMERKKQNRDKLMTNVPSLN